MFIYMVGAIGKAFWWMVEQWTSGRALTHGSGKELLKQFVPTKVDIGNVFKPGPLLRRVFLVLLALVIVLVLFELTLPASRHSDQAAAVADTPIERAYERDRRLRVAEDRRPASSANLLLGLFDDYSLPFLVTIAGAAGLTILAILSVLLLQQRRQI